MIHGFLLCPSYGRSEVMKQILRLTGCTFNESPCRAEGLELGVSAFTGLPSARSYAMLDISQSLAIHQRFLDDRPKNVSRFVADASTSVEPHVQRHAGHSELIFIQFNGTPWRLTWFSHNKGIWMQRGFAIVAKEIS